MEVKIRLQKAGKSAKRRYNYRVVVIKGASGRQGRHLEILGYYDPAQKPAVFHLNQEKLDKWLQNGARMSDTVKSLVKRSRKST